MYVQRNQPPFNSNAPQRSFHRNTQTIPIRGLSQQNGLRKESQLTIKVTTDN